jgi:ABC-type uncharacterized transport system permease subunit
VSPSVSATTPAKVNVAPVGELHAKAAQAAIKPPLDTLAIQRSLNVTPAAAARTARASPQAASNRNDEDVALLEAMFAHTGTHKPPFSASDEIKRQCGQLSGADAATCRARICVQNPSAGACHPEP